MKKQIHLILLFVLLLSNATFSQEIIFPNHKEGDDFPHFTNGYAKVYNGNLYAFINKSNELICAFEFSDLRDFSNGLAAAEKEGKWGFINTDGKWVIQPQYDIVFDFRNKQTLVSLNNHWSIINHKGKTVQLLEKAVCVGLENGNPVFDIGDQRVVMSIDGEILSKTTISNVNITHREAVLNNNSTSSCPNNIDFENGSFNEWTCFKGTVDTIGLNNIVRVNACSPIANRHQIISKNYPANVDPYGLFSLNPPDGSNFAVKLGNKFSGGEAERISFKIQVPQNDSDFSVKYDYAVVFQDPGHTNVSQPRFIARLFDSASNMYVDCASYQFISSSNIPGFASSAVDPNVKYKPWSSVYINMKAFAGRTMYLEFTTADCARRSHWGYAYLDVETTCHQNIGVQQDCSWPFVTSLNAPEGFSQYKWWNEDFSILLASGQQATLNPGPAAGTRIKLEVIPYTGFGCRDTMVILLNSNTTIPVLQYNGGNFCRQTQTNFNVDRTDIDSIRWNFGDGFIQTMNGAQMTHQYNHAGVYLPSAEIFTTAGCVFPVAGSDSIRIIQNQTSFSWTEQIQCETTLVSIQPSTHAVSARWIFPNGNILNELAPTYGFAETGNYAITGIFTDTYGCKDTSMQSMAITVIHHPLIDIISQDQACIRSSVSFVSSIQSEDSILSVSWGPVNGFRLTGDTAHFSFQEPGNHNILLTVNTSTGCVSQKTKSIQIVTAPAINVPQNVSVCRGGNVPALILDTISGLNSVVWFNQNPAIGLSSSGSGNVPAFSVSTSENYEAASQISIIASGLNGCHSDTLTYQISVHSKPVIQLPSFVNKCVQSTSSVSVSGTTANYQWSPSQGLDCYTCAQVTIQGNSISTYQVTATDVNGCQEIGSVTVHVIQPIKTNVQIKDTICVGKSYQLSASGADIYHWYPETGLSNPSIPNPIAKPSATTRYTLIARDSLGCSIDSAFLMVQILPFNRMDVSKELSAVNGSSIQLSPDMALLGANQIVSYQWTPSTNLSCTGCLNPQLTVSNPITYTLETTDNKGCTQQQSITINVLAKNAKIFIPNSFSPDGNGINDVFIIRGSGFTIKSLRIYNRYNKQVYALFNSTPNNERTGWDGKLNNVPAPSDAYTFIAELLTDEGEIVVKKGDVTLIR